MKSRGCIREDVSIMNRPVEKPLPVHSTDAGGLIYAVHVVSPFIAAPRSVHWASSAKKIFNQIRCS